MGDKKVNLYGEYHDNARGMILPKRFQNIVLIAFYNEKALGVRYLETALTNAGYRVKTIFFKDFNSVSPKPASELELQLLCREIEKEDPILVGFSVMSSMYLDTVHKVIDIIQENFSVKTVCGGAFASMFPEHFLQRGVDYVVRADGENAMCRLADAVSAIKQWDDEKCAGQPEREISFDDIPSLVYRNGREIIINEIADIVLNIDDYGIPTINSRNACFIENDRLVSGDPQLDTLSYEVIASRGCPFTCSYCCCVNLHRLYPKGTPAVRTRSVKSVIDELIAAKRECRKIIFIHFYDEIFPNLPGWVDEFIVEYKKHINLPFTIWSHPKMVDFEVLQKLKSAGLSEVIMGIQSGSPHIRRDVFHRYESQEDILKAVETIRKAGVFWASYDFMLQHPFETIEDLKETYFLVKQFRGRFELQLHGLNFLPGTDIVKMAVDAGYFTQEEIDAVMYAAMEEQFGAYWKQETTKESRLWYKMIFCLQFPVLRRLVQRFEENPEVHEGAIDLMQKIARRAEKGRYYFKKIGIVMKRYEMRLRG